MKLNTDNKKDADEKLAASESVSDSAQAEQGGAQAEAAVKTKKKPEKKKKKEGDYLQWNKKQRLVFLEHVCPEIYLQCNDRKRMKYSNMYHLYHHFQLL